MTKFFLVRYSTFDILRFPVFCLPTSDLCYLTSEPWNAEPLNQETDT
jgi:hypothetical protein